MIINNPGDVFEYEGVKYVIGDPIIVTEDDEYEGLVGSVFEIRDGEDKETDNEAPDLYCAFDDPLIPHDIEELEKRFSESYGEPKKIEDIVLDSVIMAPSMITPFAELDKNTSERTIYVLSEDWGIDADYGHNTDVFTDKLMARLAMLGKLKEETENGCITQWQNNERFVEDSGENFYECFLEGEGEANHYSLKIERQTMKMSNEFIKSLQGCVTPDCFDPEPDNPYPLCVGAGKKRCEKCGFYRYLTDKSRI